MTMESEVEGTPPRLFAARQPAPEDFSQSDDLDRPGHGPASLSRRRLIELQEIEALRSGAVVPGTWPPWYYSAARRPPQRWRRKLLAPCPLRLAFSPVRDGDSLRLVPSLEGQVGKPARC